MAHTADRPMGKEQENFMSPLFLEGITLVIWNMPRLGLDYLHITTANPDDLKLLNRHIAYSCFIGEHKLSVNYLTSGKVTMSESGSSILVLVYFEGSIQIESAKWFFLCPPCSESFK